MSQEPTSTPISQSRRNVRIGNLALLFKNGLQPKDAALMIALSISALLSIGLLIVPAFLFPSPAHNAYFHFSRMLEESAARELMLTVASACTLIAMALPAAHLPLSSSKN